MIKTYIKQFIIIIGGFLKIDSNLSPNLSRLERANALQKESVNDDKRYRKIIANSCEFQLIGDHKYLIKPERAPYHKLFAY